MTLITVINQNLESLIPIIFEFKDKISKHIIIYDNSQKDKKLALTLKEAIKKQSEASINLIDIDEDSKKDMVLIQDELEKINDTLYLNATGSDMSLIVVLSGYVLNHNGFVLAYDKFENSYNKISKNSFSNHKIENNLTLDDFFLYMGYQKSFEEDIDFAKRYQSQLKYLFSNNSRFFYNEFLLRKNNINAIDKEFKNILKSLKIIDKKNIVTKTSFGKLFEYFIYLKLNEYDFDDIKMGVNLVFDKELEVINEFDILAIKDNHIFTIECKLGTASEANNVIYKLDSLIENFGEDSKGMVINIHSSIDMIKDVFIQKKFSKVAQKRAKYNNLEVYNDYVFNERVFDEIVKNLFEVKLKNEKNLKDEPVFLLGGQDLEMEEIKKLLIKHKKPYIDKKLKWGAKLSEYINLLEQNTIYYGIELIEDVNPPKNYISIDHHNKNQKNKSSLEQVAEILGENLNRYLTLVALNDKGYIPAMKDFGATEVEIEYIREKDRQAQGVSQEDEVLARIALEEVQMIGDIAYIKSFSEKFSPIVDRCFEKYKKILIYSDKKFVYYGKGVEKLVKKYENEISKNKMYYGGNFGFFGVSEEKYNKKELEKLRKEVLKVLR